jgi:hypothetical protein
VIHGSIQTNAGSTSSSGSVSVTSTGNLGGFVNANGAPQQPPQRNVDFSRAFRSAVAAAQRAGRYVDLTEMSENLIARANKAVAAAQRAGRYVDLTEMSENLIARANKGAQEAAHNSSEIYRNWPPSDCKWYCTRPDGDFNNSCPRGIRLCRSKQWRKRFKNCKSVNLMLSKRKRSTQDQLQYQKNVLARFKARSSLVAAEKKEEELRKALEEAQKHVAESKQALDIVLRNFTVAEQVCRKSQHEKKRAWHGSPKKCVPPPRQGARSAETQGTDRRRYCGR